MPLSDEEKRILKQIEEQFYESDPKFAQAVGTSGLYRHSLRNVRWAIVGLAVGLVFLVATLQVHFLVAFGGFLLMLISAFVIERNVRAMGKAGIQDMAASLRAAGVGGKLRSRFRKD
jgi:hypothetical protein